MTKGKILMLLGSVCLALMMVAMACAAPAPTPTPTPAPTPAPTPTPAPVPPLTPAEVHHWNFFSGWTPAHWLYQQTEALVPKIEAATNGAIEIDLFALGEHPFYQADVFKSIRDRNTEIADWCGYVMGGTEPALVITDLAMFAPPGEELEAAFDRIYEEVYGPFFDEWDAVSVTPYFYRAQQWLGHEPLLSTDTLAGKNIRSWNPETAKWVSFFGGTPVSVVYEEIDAALATGLIEGMIVGATSAYTLKHFEFMKAYQLWEYGYSLSGLIVNKHALAELDEATREAFLRVMDEHKSTLRGLVDMEDRALRLAVLNYGVTIYPVDPTFMTEIKEKCRTEIWEPWLRESGPRAQRAFDIISEEMAK